MLMYVLRRLGIALLLVLATSAVVYCLLGVGTDPLQELRVSSDPNREVLIQERIKTLKLDQPLPQRYLGWLGGVAGCAIPGLSCDMGKTIADIEVLDSIKAGLVQTLRMVVFATFIAMFAGITLGVVTSLRQYSLFDYGSTFVAFLCFSLPIFWLAVLMKEYGAIQFNDFLREATISTPTSIIIGLVVGLILAGAIGKSLKFSAAVIAGSVVLHVAVLQLMSATKWLKDPSLGMPLIALFGVGTAFLLTTVFAGLRNRKALYSGLAMVGIGLAIYIPIQGLLDVATFGTIAILAVVTVAVGLAVGHLFGGYDRGQNRGVAAVTGVVVGGLITLDKFMLHWDQYYNHPKIKGRPIATIGAQTPNFDGGSFWMNGIDAFTHVILPTGALVLVGLAVYSRYSRATMLETLSQDYVRTARAKGLSERVVIVKHAFRNTLVPISTIITLTIGGLLGGAVITETIFSWSGMGKLFITGIQNSDPNPVMGFWLVTSLMSMVFIIVADILYAFLDPRVRVN